MIVFIYTSVSPLVSMLYFEFFVIEYIGQDERDKSPLSKE
jgi:hypothetical protein